MVGNGNSRQLAVRYYSDTSKFPGGFPLSIIGSEGIFYIDTSNDTVYLWDKTTSQYLKVGDDTFEGRITNLEDKYETKQLFENISGTTSGTVTVYSNISISQDNWANQNNAFAVELENGRPSQKTLFTVAGSPITAAIDASGNYALSGTPTATNYCICWLVTGKQVDFGTAGIPENKIIEEYDYDSPFVRDSDNGVILPEIDGDNLNMRSGGLLDDVRTTDPLLVSEIEQKKQQIITVAKDGGDFTTIQSAINSITDSASNKWYIIKVYPGIYTENVDLTSKSYISIEGSGELSTVINGNVKFDLQNDFLNISIQKTITTNETIVDASTISGGGITFKSVLIIISCSTSGVKPVILSVNKDNFTTLESFQINYINTSNSAIGSDTHLVELLGNGSYLFTTSAFYVQTNQSSGNITSFYDNNAGVTRFTTAVITNIFQNAAWNGIYRFIHYINNSSNRHLIDSVEFNAYGAGQGSCYAFNNDSGGSITRILSSRVFIDDNFTEKCVARAENVGDEVDFTFCEKSENITDKEAFCGDGDVHVMARNDGEMVFKTTDLVDLDMLIGTPTNRSFQDIFDIGFTAGWVSGQDITDNGDETTDITAGTGYIRISNDEQAALKSFNIEAVDDLSYSTGTNYVYLDYNSGTPIVDVTTTPSAILDNENDKYEIYEVYKESDGDLHISPHFHRAKNIGGRLQQYLYSKARIERANAEGGLILGETGDTNRNVTRSAGKVWIKLNPIPISAFDSSGSDTFVRYYGDSISGFTKTTGNTTWDNNNYWNGAALTSLDLNKYSFQEFWAEADGNLVSVYAQAQYNTQAVAENAPLVEFPDFLGDHALYIGRITFQKGDTIAKSVLSPFTGLVLGATPVTVHNSLSGLQGGTTDEYYHLDATDYTDISGNTQLAQLQTTGTPTFTSVITPEIKQTDNSITLNYIDTSGLVGQETIAILAHSSTGTVVDGMSSILSIQSENDAGTLVPCVEFEAVMTDVTDGTEDSKLNILLDENGIQVTPFILTPTDLTVPKIIAGEAQIDNININGNTIISTDTNGNMNFTPDGTGKIVLDGSTEVDTQSNNLILTNTLSGGGFIFNCENNAGSPEGTFVITHGLSGQSYSPDSDSLILDSSGQTIVRFLSSNTGTAGLIWGDSDDSDVGAFYYDHSNNRVNLRINNSASFIQQWLAGGEVVKPLQPVFSAYRNGNLTNVVGGSASYAIPYNAEIFDIGSNFNTSTGVFTAPVTGKYSFSMNVYLTGIGNTNTDMLFFLFTSNKTYYSHRENAWQNKEVAAALSRTFSLEMIDMDAGDTAYVAVYCNGSLVVDITGATNYTWFTGGLEC